MPTNSSNVVIQNNDEITQVSWERSVDSTQEPCYLSDCNKFAPVTAPWKRKTFREAWLPSDGKPTAKLLLCHGLHEHCGRYKEMAEELVKATGVAVFSLDWCGHGQSSGARGEIPSFNYFVHDALSYMHDVDKGDYPENNGDVKGLPWYVFGHSMGGCIALNLVLERPGTFSACLLAAPLVDVSHGLPCIPLVTCLSSCTSNLLPFAQNGLAPDIKLDTVCNNKEGQKRFQEDPLIVRRKPNNRLTYELFKATTRIQTFSHEIEVPTLFMHSVDDKIVPQKPSEDLYNKLNTKDKKYCRYKGVLHELINEGDEQRATVVAEMTDFMSKHGLPKH